MFESVEYTDSHLEATVQLLDAAGDTPVGTEADAETRLQVCADRITVEEGSCEFVEPAVEHECEVSGTYRLLYKAEYQPVSSRRDCWVGRDLARASDEVDFYQSVAAERRRGEGGELHRLLRWVLEHSGTAKVRCDDGCEREMLLLRNTTSGMQLPRPATVDLGWPGGGTGVSVANLGLQTTASWSARRILQSVTAEGLFQWLTALTPDAHISATHLSAAEVSACVLRSAAEQLVQLASDAASVEVPQLWVSSLLTAVHDAAARPPRGGRPPAALLRLHGWGGSTVVTAADWEATPPDVQGRRRSVWAVWRRQVCSLAFEAARAYKLRYCPSQGWTQCDLRVWKETDGAADRFIGACSLVLGKYWDGDCAVEADGQQTCCVAVEISAEESFPPGGMLESRSVVQVKSAKMLSGGTLGSFYVTVTARDALSSTVAWQSSVREAVGSSVVWNECCEFCKASPDGKQVGGLLPGAVGDLDSWSVPPYGSDEGTVQSAFEWHAAAVHANASSPAAVAVQVPAEVVESVHSDTASGQAKEGRDWRDCDDDWERQVVLIRSLNTGMGKWIRDASKLPADTPAASLIALRHCAALATQARALADTMHSLSKDLCAVAGRHVGTLPPGSVEAEDLVEATEALRCATGAPGASWQAPAISYSASTQRAAAEVVNAVRQSENEGLANTAVADAAEHDILHPTGDFGHVANQIRVLLRACGRAEAGEKVEEILRRTAAECRHARAARAAAEAQCARMTYSPLSPSPEPVPEPVRLDFRRRPANDPFGVRRSVGRYSGSSRGS
eukprot:TRINITY_DN39696_c0_g1_i1.p1 TRINITY_DN39696_c0_g1~~TRINITY_DN39696_c0_g1_i1.p1  ORF type:complete len:791 (+),score=153.99 TRINITY_DN39696_c0_g1_i1:83-2455(+)